MKQSRSKIAKVIAEKTLKSGSSDRLNSEIAAYLLSERRAQELSSIMRDVQEAWADAGQVHVVASSAHELTNDVRSLIEDKVREIYPSTKKIIISEIHDPAVIGGVRLNLANQQLDLSIEAKLNKFKQLTGGETR